MVVAKGWPQSRNQRAPPWPKNIDLIDMATSNAQRKLAELRTAWLDTEKRALVGLRELTTLLNLSELPHRIECFDVSNTQGTNTVGAMTVFEDGDAQKKHYRKFRIKSIDGANDVAAIREMIERRFKRAAAALGEAVTLSVNDLPDETPVRRCSTTRPRSLGLVA
jgi:excinuclease UvrABC nuclease subunit